VSPFIPPAFEGLSVTIHLDVLGCSSLYILGNPGSVSWGRISGVGESGPEECEVMAVGVEWEGGGELVTGDTAERRPRGFGLYFIFARIKSLATAIVVN
jgi:hypothetical protein